MLASVFIDEIAGSQLARRLRALLSWVCLSSLVLFSKISSQVGNIKLSPLGLYL
jgi:hypothetical protein